MEPTETHRILDVLDVRFRIAFDEPGLVDPFLLVFGGLIGRPRASADVAPTDVSIRVDGRAGRLVTPFETFPLVAGPLRTIHVYNLLYRMLARSISSAFLLHAAAVSRNRKAWLVAGPSGSGKTSLARALVERGFGLLSDDIAPLDVADGNVHPFPRRVGLVRDDAVAGSGVSIGDKEFVAPEALGASVEAQPLPLGGVVTLNPYARWDQGPVPVTIALVESARDPIERLRNLRGVELLQQPGPPGVTLVEARISEPSAVAAVEHEIARADRDVLFHLRGYGSEKCYAAEPQLVQLTASDAAAELLRETLNREPRSALMTRHGGSVVSALFELAGLLAGVPCYRLEPGEVAATADLLDTTFAG